MITKKSRKKENEEQVLESPLAQIFDDVDNEDGNNLTEQDDRYEALAKQIAELQRINDETQRANMALLQNPQWANQFEVKPQLEDPNKIELPDPALDPDGYSKANLQRLRVQNENDRRLREADEQKRRTVEEKAEALQEAFAEKYPELALDKERLDFVSVRVAQDAQKRGVDVQRYMFLTQDKFIDDVAKRYVKVFGEPDQEEDDDFDYEEDRSNNLRREARPVSRRNASRRSRAKNDDMVSRTGGIFGGTESGGRPSRTLDVDSGPDMIDDLHAIQKKSGFW